MKGSLDGAFAKLQWARTHLTTLEQKAPSFDGSPFNYHEIARVESDHDGREYRLFIGEVPPLDPSLALIVGDVLFNVRGALDHLVYQLHFGHFRGRIPPKIQRAAEFPIIPIMPKVPPTKWRGIAALSDRDQRAIAWLQPYVARNDELKGVREFLDILERLHVIDKHREVHVVRQYGSASVITTFPAEFGFREHPELATPLDSHMKVNTWTFEIAPPASLVEAKMRGYTGVFSEVAVYDGAEIFTLVPHLQAITNSVEVVLKRFASRFD